MLQLERDNDPQEALRLALDDFGANLWTALLSMVVCYDTAKGTCVIKPAIQARVRNAMGQFSHVSITQLPDVPVAFVGGGGFVATFPIEVGDEVLVIFSDRCIDSWWQSGGVQKPADLRMHDLSDGFALIGPR